MQSSASPSTSYAAPAVISLGEEYTDEMLPSTSSSLSFDSQVGDDGFYYSSSSDSESDSEDGDDRDYSPISPRDHPRRNSIVPSLWHAEHARLLHLQSAVLDNERAAWTREKRLESEVARIKVDLARLQQKQQSKSTDNNIHSSLSSTTTPVRTLASNPQVITATLPVPSSSTSTPPARCAGPRGPRPKPQQLRSSSTGTGANHTTPLAAAQARSTAPALLPKFSFESIKEQAAPAKPEPEHIAVTVLSHHLTQARSQRAQERQKRRNEHERMRELATLLTLGSEVRKWEERLAWSQYQSTTRAAASDDSHLNTESVAKAAAVNDNNDMDVDPRGKRLSRSSSLPSNRMSYVPPLPTTTTTTTTSNNKPPLSPALPSLALSPLWRVSAEMILRRRQLSERPRRTPPAPLAVVNAPVATTIPIPVPTPAPTPAPPALVVPAVAPVSTTTTTLARPAHTLRGPRDKRNVSSSPSNSGNANVSATATTSSSSTLNLSGTSSGSGSLSAKRNSIPPPISIPPSAPFLVSTSGATAPVDAAHLAVPLPLSTPTGNSSISASLLSKTTPIKPSALKWAFTAADLAREMEEEKEQTRQKAVEEEEEETMKTMTIALASQSSPCRTESSVESSEESGSDDSGKSSSDGSGSSSSSSSAGQECPERRGRARFSWRKSLPKDGNASTNASATMPLPPPPSIASASLET